MCSTKERMKQDIYV